MKKIIDYTFWILFLIPSAFLLWEALCFMQQHVICAWDEAVYAHNAFNMSENKECLRYYFFDEVNHYNSKPPLVIWLQSLCILLLGKTACAIRLPSLLALLSLLVYFFFWIRKMKLPNLLFPATVLALLCIPGLMRPHVFLTGDLDAMLVFFTSLIQLYALYAFSQKEWPPHFIRNMMLLFVGAYFTKSTAVFLILPALLVFAIGFGKWKSLLLDKKLYTYALLFIGLLTGYYALREVYNPGHFQTVYHSEFLRLYEKVMHWHVQPFRFYFELIYDRDNPMGLLVTLVGLPFFFLLPAIRYKKIVVMLLLASLANLLFVSMPPVKLEWYPAPIYPLWALMNALIFISLYERVCELQKTYFILPLCVLFLSPVLFAHRSIQRFRQHIDPVEQEAAALQSLPNVYTQVTLLRPNDEHNEVAYIYATWIKSSPRRINIKNQLSEIKPGDSVLVCDVALKDSLVKQANILWQQSDGLFAVKKWIKTKGSTLKYNRR